MRSTLLDILGGLWAFFRVHSFPIAMAALFVFALLIFAYVIWLERRLEIGTVMSHE
jgi:hypothetical protein